MSTNDVGPGGSSHGQRSEQGAAPLLVSLARKVGTACAVELRVWNARMARAFARGSGVWRHARALVMSALRAALQAAGWSAAEAGRLAMCPHPTWSLVGAGPVQRFLADSPRGRRGPSAASADLGHVAWLRSSSRALMQRNANIVAAYRKGASTSTIARAHQLSAVMVRRILAAQGVRLRIRRRRWTATMERQLRAMWGKEHPRTIARALGVAVQTVRRRATRVGLRTPSSRRRLTAALRESARAACGAGGSVREIARALGFAYQSIHPLVRDLIPPGRRRHRYRLDEGFFDRITPASAYWLGFLVADGHVDPDRKSLVVTLARRDRDHLLKLRATLRATHPVRDGVQSGPVQRPISRLFFYAPRLTRVLVERHGFDRGKPGRAIWPKGTEWTPELLGHFLRGVFDGDGSWASPRAQGRSGGRRPQQHFRLTGDRRLLLGVRRFLERTAGVRRVRLRRNGRSRRCWVLSYQGNINAARVASIIYPSGTDWARSSMALTRKYQRYAQHMAQIGGARLQRRLLSAKEIADALRRIAAGESRTAVAQRFGVSRALLRYYERMARRCLGPE